MVAHRRQVTRIGGFVVCGLFNAHLLIFLSSSAMGPAEGQVGMTRKALVVLCVQSHGFRISP